MQSNPMEMEQIWSKSGKEKSLKSLFIGFSDYYDVIKVPRLGLEPRCLAALVFETSASTYSAIWA